MRASRLLTLTFVLLSLPTAALADGKLDRARDAIRGGGGGDGDGSAGGDEDDDDGDNLLEALINALFGGGSTASHPPPSEVSSSDGEPEPELGYAHYPYARGHRGYLLSRRLELAIATDLDDGTVPVRPLGRGSRLWGTQLALEGGYFDGVTHVGPALRVLTPTRIELDTRLSMLREDLEGTAPRMPDVDTAMLGATHFSYRLLQAEQAMFRMGLGARYFFDEHDLDGGPDMLLGADFFPVRPMVLSLELTGGLIGDAASVSARAQLGVMLGRVELFGGYEHLLIGDVTFPMPLIGTRLWL